MKRIYKRYVLAAAGWLAVTLTSVPVLQAAPAARVSDVRVLIDVSGSMKWNDPHNLRAPALRLLVGLLPQGARAGVWTFAQYTNMLVPEAAVDPHWQDQARKASLQIASNGLRTNIEDALQRATWDWNRPDPHMRRSILLLTDGIVDVSKDKRRSVVSRRHILDDIIPRLQQAGVTVYTVALSHGADAALLRRMAAGTGGWYEQVENAAGLEKAFLHMFEKTTHRDTLPLVDNAVKVDAQVRELTLLVFRKDGSQPSRLVSPAGATIAQADAPGNVHWHHESRYDLITIEHPAAGRWKILADEDPDNRVMVVTNLRMQATALPNHLLAGRSIPFTVSFTEQGKTITRPAFLRFVETRLIQSDEGGSSTTTVMHDDGRAPDAKAGDGVYSALLGGDLSPGHHEVRVVADGVTFQRQSQQLLSVEASPVITSLAPDIPDKPAHYILSVIPRAGLIDTKTMAVHATITAPGGAVAAVDVPHPYADEWRYAIAADGKGGTYHVAVTVTARGPDGTQDKYDLDPLSFGVNTAPASAPPAPAVTPVAAPAAPAPKPTPAAAPQAAAAPDWSVAAVLLLLLNLLVIGGGYVVYLGVRRSTATALRPLEEELL